MIILSDSIATKRTCENVYTGVRDSARRLIRGMTWVLILVLGACYRPTYPTLNPKP